MQPLQELILPSLPPQRRVAIPFSHCHYVHIPAIQHGFMTAQLLIQAFNDQGIPILDVQIQVHPLTYLVRLAFIRGEFSPWAPWEERLAFFLMPPQSGTVVITGLQETIL